MRVQEQPGCSWRVAAPQAGADGERVSRALRHMLGYICGSGSLLAQATSLPGTGVLFQPFPTLLCAEGGLQSKSKVCFDGAVRALEGQAETEECLRNTEKVKGKN